MGRCIKCKKRLRKCRCISDNFIAPPNTCIDWPDGVTDDDDGDDAPVSAALDELDGWALLSRKIVKTLLDFEQPSRASSKRSSCLSSQMTLITFGIIV